MKSLRIPPVVAAALLAYGLVYALWSCGYQALYRRILEIWGISPFRFPFLDLDAILSARQCWSEGINVFLRNPCDILGRPHFYSPLWLLASGQRGSRPDLQSVGLALDVAFLLSLWLLPQPRTTQGRVLTLAATLSTMVAYALERANNDLVIFILLIISVRSIAAASPWRLLGYGGFLLATLLKFYPLVLITTVLRETPRRLLAVAAAFCGCVMVGIAAAHDQLGTIAKGLPSGLPFTDLFGARNLPVGMGQLLDGTPAAGIAPTVVAMGLLLLWFINARRVALVPDLAADVDAIEEPAKLFLITGMVVLTGCFFAGPNVDYRGIFFLLILPGLVTLVHSGRIGSRQVARGLLGVALFLMWSEAFRQGLAALVAGLPRGLANRLIALFWLARELAWWWLMAAFAGILWGMLRQTPVGTRWLSGEIITEGPL